MHARITAGPPHPPQPPAAPRPPRLTHTLWLGPNQRAGGDNATGPGARHSCGSGLPSPPRRLRPARPCCPALHPKLPGLAPRPALLLCVRDRQSQVSCAAQGSGFQMPHSRRGRAQADRHGKGAWRLAGRLEKRTCFCPILPHVGEQLPDACRGTCCGHTSTPSSRRHSAAGAGLEGRSTTCTSRCDRCCREQ